MELLPLETVKLIELTEGSSCILGRNTRSDQQDSRTGKWSNQETVYCEKLMQHFENGQLPLNDGLRLHEFLSTMLNCKQSRLTKKFINAKLSSKCFIRTSGWIHEVDEAQEFSKLELDFVRNIEDDLEQAEVDFYLKKVWREYFSTLCGAYGQPLQATAWLDSWAAELDRRSKRARDIAMESRKRFKTSPTAAINAGNNNNNNTTSAGQSMVQNPIPTLVTIRNNQQHTTSSSVTSLHNAPLIRSPVMVAAQPKVTIHPIDISTTDHIRHDATSTHASESVDLALEDLFNANEERLHATENVSMAASLTNTVHSNRSAEEKQIRDEIVSVLGEYMPIGPDSPGAAYSHSFVALRLLFLRADLKAHDEANAQMMINSYRSYIAGGREKKDVASLLARDYMFLMQNTAMK
jgi:hypothetical protein